jgi:hypothetical protein
VKITILNSAKRDLIEGFYFYESQGKGVGEYFLESIFSDVESLRLYAGIHSIQFGRFHRLLAKRFPFAIYYKTSEDEITVYAILDCRRDPAWIRERMDSDDRT